MEKTKFHLPKNLSDVLCYFIVLFAVAVFIVEKNDKETRFVAGQSICIYISLIIIVTVLSIISALQIPIVVQIVSVLYFIVGLVALVLILFLAIGAAINKRIKLPYLKVLVNKFI